MINRLMAEGDYDLIVASQDWHPPTTRATRSIRARSRSTWGRSAASRRSCGRITASRAPAMPSSIPELDTERIHFVQRKGEDSEVDSTRRSATIMRSDRPGSIAS